MVWNGSAVFLDDFEDLVADVLPSPRSKLPPPSSRPSCQIGLIGHGSNGQQVQKEQQQQQQQKYPWRVKWWLGEPFSVPGTKAARFNQAALDNWVKAEASRCVSVLERVSRCGCLVGWLVDWYGVGGSE